MVDGKAQDRLDAWWDGSAICVIAVGSQGDPLDLEKGRWRPSLRSCRLACVKHRVRDATS